MTYLTDEERAYKLGFDDGVNWAKTERERLITVGGNTVEVNIIRDQIRKWEAGASLADLPKILRIINVSLQDLGSIKATGKNKAGNLAGACLSDWERIILDKKV